MDWFSEFELEDTWTLTNEPSHTQEPHFLDTVVGRDVVHKRGLNLDMSKMIDYLYRACDPGKHGQMDMFVHYLILHTYGKRNIRKDAIEETNLSPSQQEVYKRIRQEIQDPIRRRRVLAFINDKNITKRLINYFVVHYALIEQEFSYYLDKTTYPYKVIGELNNPDQPDILRRKEAGENIVWINLHQEYKNSKNRNGRRNRHAPYKRSISVRGADGEEYSLCELNFYIWLDEVGGFDLFYMFEDDIRQKKAKYDEEHRIQENQLVFGKRKKRKIVLRQTNGQNYKTHVIQYKSKPPFSLHAGNDGPMSDYFAEIQVARVNAKRKK